MRDNSKHRSNNFVANGDTKFFLRCPMGADPPGRGVMLRPGALPGT